ncbi:hypothetical protein ADL26_05110, partial [Thermoactinomyces vulgaris]
IETRGWAQEEFILDNGKVCAVGAMRLATAAHIGLTETKSAAEIICGSKSVWPEDCRDALKNAFDEATQMLANRIGGQYIPNWNDDWGQTAEQVASTMRAAAEGGV